MANQITTIYGRTAMAEALGGKTTLPKVVSIAFGDSGHDPANPAKAKDIPENRSDLFRRVATIPVATVTYPATGIVRFSVTLSASSIPGGIFSEAAIVDKDGKALAIQTFGLKTIGANETFTYEWEEVI
jgi:hypothetical protein